MEINKLEIENFKLFAKEEFVFNPHFNLVIGVNGSGKTSLLRAISVALGNWAHGYMKDKNNYRPIFSDEIREIQINNRFDKSKKSSIKSYGKSAIINNKGNKKTVIAEWSNKYHFGIESSETLPTIEATVISAKYIESSKQHLLNFDSLGQEVLNFIEKGDNFNLPLIAFYECDRLWLASKKEPNIEEVAQIRHSRFDPYVDCFHIGLKGNSAIVEWLIQNELISLQQGEEFPVLKSIQKAATGALENCSGIRFNFKQRRVIVEFEDKTSIPFEHLSDGQRTLLGLFCDLARRAAILNPH
ncbi:MAG: AAA family ATPase, partial [Methylococcaceae bacterium]|nr:AAA family ATPase [Methylococcaceae bacterium]